MASISPTTLVPEVADVLKGALANALVGAGYEGRDVQVVDAMSADNTPWDLVIMGDIVAGSNTYSIMRAGRKPRDEEWIQQVYIYCHRPGREASASRHCAFALYTLLEDIIANDPSLGIQAPLTAVISGYNASTTTEASLNGWRCVLRVDVKVTARLR